MQTTAAAQDDEVEGMLKMILKTIIGILNLCITLCTQIAKISDKCS